MEQQDGITYGNAPLGNDPLMEFKRYAKQNIFIYNEIFMIKSIFYIACKHYFL